MWVNDTDSDDGATKLHHSIPCVVIGTIRPAPFSSCPRPSETCTKHSVTTILHVQDLSILYHTIFHTSLVSRWPLPSLWFQNLSVWPEASRVIARSGSVLISWLHTPPCTLSSSLLLLDRKEPRKVSGKSPCLTETLPSVLPFFFSTRLWKISGKNQISWWLLTMRT